MPAGRPLGAQNKDKPFREALRMAQAAADGDGGLEAFKAPKGSLRWIAKQLLMRAGNEVASCKEVADRLDGRVPYKVGGDEEGEPVTMIVTGVPRAGRDTPLDDPDGSGINRIDNDSYDREKDNRSRLGEE